jgi:putative ABC transport system permease protein
MASPAAILGLAGHSLWNRRHTVLLTVLSIALSVALVLSVERVRSEARTGFASTIAGTDLIVGARSGDLNLLLYTVFRIGNATNNISWESYETIAALPQVAWTIPVSLGDSHRGYRVLGTTGDYFRHYRFGRQRPLEFRDGGPFGDTHEAVLGADVAEELGYDLGAELVLAHGLGRTSFAPHDDQPFRVAGILKRTGTPVDRTVHVSLAGMEAIHRDWQSGARMPLRGKTAPAAGADDSDHDHSHDHEPAQITAFLVGLKSRGAAFRLQRQINEFPGEPLMAIIPGVVLQQLWQLIRVVEVALLSVSVLVVAAGLVGMLTAILTSLNERRREMAVLRAVGARPWHILALLVSEAGLMALAGVLLGFVLVYGLLLGAAPWLENSFGIFLESGPPGPFELAIGGAVIAAALLMALIPAWRAYRTALADGLSVRL